MAAITDPLKLTPAMFHILLALSDGARHGLGILREVDESMSDGVRLGPGKLYWSINKLVELGLIREPDERPPPQHDDPRRRYYALTAAGHRALTREAARLERVVEHARAKGILDQRASL
ncbi:MAG: helix-turn-helix transcriptional regulator [Gemmatimonadota bacterium]|nr:MAG: helix-turn-helix transcriptional regulator [Gemmatimonadota bacterium]